MPEDLVRIATFHLPIEAHLARLRLEARGIASFVFDENMVAYSIVGLYGGVRLMVRESDVQRAVEILNEQPLAPDSDESDVGNASDM
jgi:hypothetical protein